MSDPVRGQCAEWSGFTEGAGLRLENAGEEFARVFGERDELGVEGENLRAET